MRIDERDQVMVITFQADQYGDLWRTVEPLLGKGKRAFVIDMTQITFLNSLAIASIITVRNKVTMAGGIFALAGMADHIKSVFRILKLERLFGLDLTLDQAVASVK